MWKSLNFWKDILNDENKTGCFKNSRNAAVWSKFTGIAYSGLRIIENCQNEKPQRTVKMK